MAWYNWFHTVKTTVKMDVPKWEYCNYINPSNPGVGLADCCRFATRIKARGATSTFTCCSLYNQSLTTDFEMIKKCPQCWKATRSRKVDLDFTGRGGDDTLSTPGRGGDDMFTTHTPENLYAAALSESSIEGVDTPNSVSASSPRRRATEVKAIAVSTVSAFIATYKALRTSGLSEALALNAAKTEVINNKEEI